MKKASLKLFSLLISFLVAFCIMKPFSISADVTGFDYTNYYELNYVQSSGSQYINTGIAPTYGNTYNDLKILADMQYVSFNNGNEYLFGTAYYNQDAGLRRNLIVGYRPAVSTSNLTYFYGAGASNATAFSGATADTNRHVFGIDFNSSSRQYIYDSTTKSFTATYNSSFSNSIIIFGGRNATVSDVSIAYFSYAKLYNFKIYKGNTLISDLYPAERKSDNAIGVYDTVREIFINGSGNNNLISGGRKVTQYVISTGVSPSGSGSVSGGGTYDSGDNVTLTATASNGYVFDHWSDGSTVNPLTTTATSDITYTAYFVSDPTPPVNQYVISTDVSPAGSGVVTGGGTYASGSTIQLTATANNGYEFSQWSDGNTSNPRSLTVSSSATYTAIFTAVTPSPTQYTVTTSVNPSGSGSVTGGGTYNSGSNVTLTATPNTGYVFSTWSDGVSSNPRSFVITSNISLTATFIQDTNTQKIIGSNISIFDYEIFANGVNNGSSGVPQIQGYTFPTTSPANRDNYFLYFSDIYFSSAERYLFQVDTILNDDYIGYVTVSSTNLSSFSTRNVYVNGNHFTFTFLMISDYGSSVNFTMDTSHLILNKSVQSLIQDGTPESNISSDNLDDITSAANESFDEAILIENDFTTDMNDALDDIDTSFSPSSMGSKFQSSAIWVSQQFNRMTNDTPFGSLIGFSLVLGLALLIIGRVL